MSIKTKANLTTDTGTAINDNTTRDISPSDVRGAIVDLIDSSINRIDDKPLLNLREYNTARAYEVGEGSIRLGVIYQCTTATTGTFNGANWSAIIGPETLAIGALSDVTISSPVNGQVLTYSGGQWVNMASASGVSGSGTLNKIAKWSGGTSLTDSLLTDEQATPGVKIGGSFYPDTTNTYSLGGPVVGDNRYWKTLWLHGETRASSDLTWHVGSGIAQMKLETNGRLSIGSSITAAGKLHIRGGGTSATDSFYVENDTPTVWYRLRDDRRIIYLDGNEAAGKVLTSDGSGVATWQIPAGGGLTVGTTSIASGTIGGILFQGTGNVLQQDATNFFWDDTNNRLGIGLNAPGATLDVASNDNTSATFALKIKNSTPLDLFTIKSNGEQFNIANTTLSYPFYFKNNNSGTDSRTQIQLDDFSGNTSAKLSIFGSNYTTVSALTSSAVLHPYNAKLNIQAYANSGANLKQIIFSSFVESGSVYTEYARFDTGGNFGIGVDPTTAKFYVKGSGSTSATFAQKIENSAAALLMTIKDNGLIAMPLLQTGNAGLAAGDLYKDTAANILTAADYVVGMKA